MGVHLSTTATLAPLSLASITIGIISFAFTVATFLRVFWTSIMTIFSAATEAPDILTTLRQELYEERNSLRALRRHLRARGGQHARDVFSGPELDEVVIRTLQKSIKDLCRKFKGIERPFLAEREKERRGQTRRRSRTRRESWGEEDGFEYYTGVGSRTDWDDEKGGGRGVRRREREREQDRDWDEEEDYSRSIYCNMTLGRRIVWLRYRGDAMNLLASLARVQTRRIARQVGEIAVVLHEYGDVFAEMRHNISLTESRMNRVVGIRRVD
ncbi:hypothetical protein MBLNU457_2134t2 [Dothideomycetes sp. NU457]